MNIFEKAKYRMIELDDSSRRNTIINKLHPVIKILTTIGFLVCVLSVNKYDLSRLIYFIVWPILLIIAGDIKIKPFLKLMFYLSPFLIAFVIANVIIDRIPVLYIGNFYITTGMISALTLLIKNVYSILACYILISTTGIYNICYGLNKLHFPEIITNQILLTFRYIFVLINEADEMYTSYQLRAPKQKGIKHTVWGPFLGSLFLRSSSRADELYDSMVLRGYNNKIYEFKKVKIKVIDLLFLLLCIGVFTTFLFWKGF